jgi:DNA modification methylase
VNYGGGISAENSQGYKVRTINNDNLGEKFQEFVKNFVKQLWEFSLPGAIVYLVMGAQEWPLIDQTLREKGFHWSSTIVWVKDQLVLSRKDYHTQYEPLWYGWRGDAARLQEVVDRKQSDTWFIDRPKRSEEHPTMKPLELVERSINNSSKDNAIVMDLFSGSGTTLMACERLGRICRAMENDPRYVAVGLERWSVATGLTPIVEG